MAVDVFISTFHGEESKTDLKDNIHHSSETLVPNRHAQNTNQMKENVGSSSRVESYGSRDD